VRVRWRTGPEGYGLLTKLLHWTTVLLVAAQFAVGWWLDLDDCDPAAEDRSGGDTGDAADDRLDRLEDACEARADRVDLLGGGFDLPELHLTLGLLVLAIGAMRPLWRRLDGFPAWSEALSPGEQRLVHGVERSLMALLVLVPLSGIVMVLTRDDDWLPLHVTAHAAFFLALGLHLFTNLRPAVLRRML
jgi:cytochrome b561